MNTRISRRQFLHMAGAGGLSFAVLSACAPSAPAQPAAPTAAAATAEPASPSAEIHVLCWGDLPDKAINEGAVAAFAKVNNNIKVTVDFAAGEFYDKVKVDFAGGTPSDLVYIEGYRWQPYADLVIPLDEYIQKDNMAKSWPDVPNYNILTTWRGKTYMSVIDTGSMVMQYNKDLFDKRGVPYPKEGWTFSDFKELVAKLSFEEDGKKYYGWSGGYGGIYAYVGWVPFLRMDGKLEFDTLAEPKKSIWSQPEIVDAVQFVSYDCIANSYSPSPEAAQAGGVGFTDGRVAINIDGPWALPYMWGPSSPDGKGINFEAIDVPVGSLGKPMPDAEIQGHMIAKACENKDAAWEVMKFWTGDEVQMITAQNGRMCGTPEQTDRLWVPIATKSFNFKNAAAFAQAQLHGQCPMVSGAGANYDALSGPGSPLLEAFDALQVNAKSAKEAFADADPKIQTLLDDYWAKQPA